VARPKRIPTDTDTFELVEPLKNGTRVPRMVSAKPFRRRLVEGWRIR
jgi:hypothetical protein